MYRHGVFISEASTPIIQIREISAGIPVVVGAAPIQRSGSVYADVINKPQLITDYQEYIRIFGDADRTEWSKYTLNEFAYVFFNLYGVGPAIFINTLNPATMGTAVTDESITLVDGMHTIDADVDISTLEVKSSDGVTTYTRDGDYTAVYCSDGVLITRIATGAITSNTATLKLSYKEIPAAPVAANDIIAGLEYVETVYPLYSLIPGMILAPGFSHLPAVGLSMVAKTKSLDDKWNSIAIADVDSSSTGADTYSGVSNWKTTNNYIDSRLVLGWPKVKLGDDIYWMSSHIAGMFAVTDLSNDDVPYVSPSNKRMKINGLVDEAGNDVILTGAQANVLNANGVTTGINFNGWRLWGNYTSDSASGDPKDLFACIRRMFNWVGNNAVLLLWNKLDQPIKRSNVETAVDSINQWLNGLISKGAFNDAHCEFIQSENPNEDLAAGKIRLHLYMTPPSPAQEIICILQYDVDGNRAIFS